MIMFRRDAYIKQENAADWVWFYRTRLRTNLWQMRGVNSHTRRRKSYPMDDELLFAPWQDIPFTEAWIITLILRNHNRFLFVSATRQHFYC